jgi:hypothetical protein
MNSENKQEHITVGEHVAVRCQACGYRQNLKASEIKDPSKIICTGKDCDVTFSAKEGIKRAIASDNDYMAWCFISDTMIYGKAEIIIGTAKTITLETPVKAVKKVFLYQDDSESDDGTIYLVHKFALPDKLVIISSTSEERVGKPVDVNWTVYANMEEESIQPWRDYLRKAKESLINEDYPDAIIEAEIAVEVTLEEIVWELLIKRKKLDEDVADWILNQMKGVSDRSKQVMELAIGKKISDIDPVVYKAWVNSVAKKRNLIVHQGYTASKEEALEAIGAAFEIIWLMLELVDRKPVKL